MTATCSMALRFFSISVIALGISGLYVPIALADGNDGPRVDGNELAHTQPGGTAAGGPSLGGGNSATVSFEYFPNGAVKRIQMHCSKGTAPRIDSEGGVMRQSCQPVAAQPRAI